MPTPPATTQKIESVVHPAEDFPADRTVVWSPLFQAAWDRMNDELGGRPLRVVPENELMAKLDSFVWQADRDLPAIGWKLWSGPNTEEFVDAANREAAQMIGEAEGPFSPPLPLSPEIASLAVLALLNRNPAFKAEFHRDPISLRFCSSAGEGKTIQCFGIGDADLFDYAEAVRILHYGPDSKAIRIAVRKEDGDDDSRGESVVLYLPSQRENFDVAWARVKGWLREEPRGEYGSEADPCLHEGDRLCIPYLGLEAKADFAPKLEGARYHPGAELPWVIGGAKMRTQFKMTEKGVQLRVVVEITAVGCAPIFVPTVPRDLRFDRPFFVFLCRDGGEWPYFGAWFGDHAALTESSDPELIEERGDLQVFRRPDTGEEYTVTISRPFRCRVVSEVMLRYAPAPGAGVREAFVLQAVFQGVAFWDRKDLLESLRAGRVIEVPGIERWKAEEMLASAGEKGLMLELVEPGR